MAKRRLKSRITRAQNRIQKELYWGKNEPTIGKEVLDGAQLGAALNWYYQTKDVKHARSYAQAFLTEVGRKKDAVVLERVHDNWINRTACWLCRLSTGGAKLSERVEANRDRWLREMLEKAPPPEDGGSPKPTVRDHLQEKLSDLCGELNGMVDDGTEIDMESFLTENAVSPRLAKMIADRFRPIVDSLVEDATSSDPGDQYAYRGYTPEELALIIESYATIVAGAESFDEEKKVEKRPRRRKEVPVDKQVVRLKYLPQTEDGLRSISPTKIVGARELWLYNTKYRTITVLRSETGLGVKTVRVVGYDPENSGTFRTGRGKRPTSIVRGILDGNRSSLRKITSGLAKCPKPQDRTTEETLLLRAL